MGLLWGRLLRCAFWCFGILHDDAQPGSPAEGGKFGMVTQPNWLEEEIKGGIFV